MERPLTMQLHVYSCCRLPASCESLLHLFKEHLRPLRFQSADHIPAWLSASH